ncbi:hypothetical protein BU24DRAFT_341125 [Aaosphaeria arxii CBS 175.79]|uniref:Ribosomal RNA methyltransferase FtsJ domain-containing protein n=1 Tax=Aaosphaeria arxii CBS 175.79 TaxID=1450172 RepID=A0A6A5Y3D7_9PLEO|nr:uncharacterized protein BU24DRAFT_341125 [Aaosphaeria arxii CBS 175.79]KAF2019547.1 hypothetical protein BU24DRAFT_341125 [Aaosphaeria arxii CBS 175.79]
MSTKQASLPSDRTLDATSSTDKTSQDVVNDYFMKYAEFRELDAIKKKGWENPKADNFFKERRSQADKANTSAQKVFYTMMQQIGDELNRQTGALQLPPAQSRRPTVLDICMAAGGFTSAVMKCNSDARVSGITLPVKNGGHFIHIPGWQNDHRLRIRFLDITMLAKDMGVEAKDVPTDHPDAQNFIFDQPFSGQDYDLVFCDGQVLRTHERPDYREHGEIGRLRAAQLVLAMQRIRENGRLVMLLHRNDAVDVVSLLYTLSRFSSIRLFKPQKKHAMMSSFYVIAEGVHPRSQEALDAVEMWKKQWHAATFGSDDDVQKAHSISVDYIEGVLADFGEELVKLSLPLWRTQYAALRKSEIIS